MMHQLLVNGAAAGCAYALLGIGFALIYRAARLIHLAHGAVYAGAAYLAYFMIGPLGLDRSVGFFLRSR